MMLSTHVLSMQVGVSWSPGLLTKDFPEDPSWREAELGASDTLSRRAKLPPRRQPECSV
jgi:hypothetical protein